MVTLTEEMVIARTKISNLESITKLNFCSRELSDVSILQKMKNVTVLSLSVNNIDSMEVFQFLPKLEELFLRKNNISDLNQVCYLQSLPELQSLWLQDNPCAANDEEYRLAVIRALPRLKKLDNQPIETSEIDRAHRIGRPLAHPALEASEGSEDEDEHFYLSHQNRENPQQQHERSPSPDEEYYQEKYSPEPNGQMPQKKDFTNSTFELSNNGYANELEDPKEIYNEQAPLNLNYSNHRQAAPAYNKYEEDGPPRPQNHRPQGMLPRSRTTDGELGHYNCPNWSCSQGHRRPNERRTNVLNAVLCLIKELDYPNLEVVHMAVKCRMQDLCDDHLPIQ